MRLQELIERLPKDTEARVDKTRKRHNTLIREILRQETGLRLRRAGLEQQGPPADETITVPISVVAGMPEKLQDMVFSEKEADLLLMGQHRGDLLLIKQGLPGVQSLLTELALFGYDTGNNLDEAAQKLLEFANKLLNLVDKAGMAKKLLSVNEDVLGAYWYVARNWRHDAKSYIELYYGVLGLLARMLGVAVEPLTVVVMAHECAHAYTHLGMDIDGERWDTEAFLSTERALKEGLAQYYTYRVCKRLETTMPEAMDAYAALLPQQPDPYWTHCDWIDGFTPEEVRLALLDVRRRGGCDLEAFERGLVMAKDVIGRRQTRLPRV